MPTDQVPEGFNTPVPSAILTPDHVDSRVGRLDFVDGVPTAETAERVFDHLDFLRGVEVFLNCVPAASIEAMRLGFLSQGIDACNKLLIMDELLDSGPFFLTGNTDTVYCGGFLDLKKDGPTVVEIPPGCGPGTVNDAWFRFVIDMGAPGADRGAGGKYLILPPDFDGEVPDGYFVATSPSYVNWLILRGFLVDGKPDTAATMFRDGLKIYPLAEIDDPPETFNVNLAVLGDPQRQYRAQIGVRRPITSGPTSAASTTQGKARSPGLRTRDGAPAMASEAIADEVVVNGQNSHIGVGGDDILHRGASIQEVLHPLPVVEGGTTIGRRLAGLGKGHGTDRETGLVHPAPRVLITHQVEADARVPAGPVDAVVRIFTADAGFHHASPVDKDQTFVRPRVIEVGAEDPVTIIVEDKGRAMLDVIRAPESDKPWPTGGQNENRSKDDRDHRNEEADSMHGCLLSCDTLDGRKGFTICDWLAERTAAQVNRTIRSAWRNHSSVCGRTSRSSACSNALA